MKKLILERYTYGSLGTLGRMDINDSWSCFTIERPWMGNAPNLSCIPEGLYPVVLGRFNAGGYDCYELPEVPGRTLIKIHIANTMDDLLGCIGIGHSIGRLDGLPAVLESSSTHGEFMNFMDGSNGMLHVKGTYHGV